MLDQEAAGLAYTLDGMIYFDLLGLDMASSEAEVFFLTLKVPKMALSGCRFLTVALYNSQIIIIFCIV